MHIFNGYLAAVLLPLIESASIRGRSESDRHVSNSDQYKNDHLSDEIMETSPQAAFRPFFRYQQMIEERKRREEARLRVQEMQRVFSQYPSEYSLHYDHNFDLYLCNKQGCRQATHYDISLLQSMMVNNAKVTSLGVNYANPHIHTLPFRNVRMFVAPANR